MTTITMGLLVVAAATAAALLSMLVTGVGAVGEATTTNITNTTETEDARITYVQFSNPPPIPTPQQQTVDERFTNLLLDLNKTSEWEARNIMVNESQTEFTVVMLSTNQNTTWVESQVANVSHTYGFDLLLYDFLYGKYPTIVLVSQPQQPPQQPIVAGEEATEEEVTEEETTTTTPTEEETTTDEGGGDSDNEEEEDNGGNSDSDNEGGPLDEQVQDIEDLFDENPNNDPPCQGSSCEEFEDLFGSNNNNE